MSETTKRRIVYCSPLVVVLALLVVARVELGRIEAEAQDLAATGRSVIALLGELSAGLTARDAERVAACYADDYEHSAQGSWTREPRGERDGIRVYDWREAGPREAGPRQAGPRQAGPRRFGKADVVAQLERYMESLAEIGQIRFKLGRIEERPAPERTVARAVLWTRGTTPSGEAAETFLHLRLWLRRDGGDWRIHRQALLRGETVTGDRRGFTDVTARAGVDFRARRSPDWATPEWFPHTYGIVKYAAAGVSAADVDGDGWTDLFFGDGVAPRLYRNRGDGTFDDVTAAAGLPLEFPSVSFGLFADFDNDGDQDLFVGRKTRDNRLFRNDGGTFTDVTAGAGLGGEMVTTAAAGDYDGDGDLDLYVGRYLDPRTELPTTLFYTRNSMGNSLLRNEGDLRFTDVTAEAGVRDGGPTVSVVWADYDEDGFQDLYVANDFSRNALLRNRGDGTFADVSHETGAIGFGYGMSASFGDVEGDGDLDLYVSNIHSAQRWYGQAATIQYLRSSVRQGTIREDFPLYREIYGLIGDGWHDFGDQMIRGNSLLINDGTGHFTDVAEAANANPFGWYWTSTFFDYDNDGRLDIYGANGWISGKTHDDL